MEFSSKDAPNQFVWDKEKNRLLCKFNNGKLETDDKYVFKRLCEMIKAKEVEGIVLEDDREIYTAPNLLGDDGDQDDPGDQDGQSAGDVDKPISEMTVAELKAFAEANDIDLGGAKNKGPITDAILDGVANK